MCGMRISILGQESSASGDEIREYKHRKYGYSIHLVLVLRAVTSLKKLPASRLSALRLRRQSATFNRLILLG
jgi:hypothetical protein